MKTTLFHKIVLLALIWCGWASNAHAQTPPVVRSTEYNGSYSNIVYYAAQPWMNTNTTLLTVEAWIYCRDLIGNQALVARHYSTNLYFGLAGNKLRFYRSGGTFADSDGTIAVGRWTHVATTYDGTTARFYINGALAGTKGLANAGNNSTNSLSLGGQRDVLNLGDVFAGGFAFNGFLDEVRLWTVVRSQSQISAGLYEELRSGTGLLATFGSGGSVNELRSGNGSTDGIAVDVRRSGFGILPVNLRIPFSAAALRADGIVDMLNEYRGAETIVLRSTLNGTTPDQRGYLMVSTNSTNFHLYVAVPDIQQSGFLPAPSMQVAGNVNLANGTTNGIGDWEGRLTQDSFQGGTIYGVNPPFFPNASWLSWGQSTQNWQAATTSPYEFHQDYEFRIHGRHLNYFSNSVGLLVRYYGFNGAEQLVAPRGGVTNQPGTYATAEWGGVANVGLINVAITGEVNNVTIGGNQSGWTVTLRSGASALGGVIIRTLPVAADGTFTISGEVPREQPIHLILESRSGYTILPSEYYGDSGRVASSIPANSTLTYAPCSSGACTYRNVRFRVQSPPGPLALTSVAPLSVPATVLVRTTPRKTTPVSNLTLTGANLHSGIRVFFRGPGCFEEPPNFCGSDWVEGEIVSTAFDRTSVVVAVPELPGTGAVARNFQIVVENPIYLSTSGNHWTYGPTVSMTPPIYAHLYGFEFRNDDDGPSLEEFEANFGDNIFVDLPFTDIAVPGIRDPYYYGFFFPVYMAWMDLAKGSCSGFAATSRLMANRTIPFPAFDRADNGEGIHGVLYTDGYAGLPPCDPEFATRLCVPKPAAWTGFDLFQPFRPIDVWGRIISLQGAQTSAEFLNTWLPQLKRPILSGPRRGISVGDPNLVLSRIRTDARENLIVLGGREFQALHTVTPYGVIEEQGLLDDLLTPTPRAGFTLIKIYDNNWPESERYIEVNRTENTFRYFFFNSDSGPVIGEGAGLYYMPVSVFRNPRHALGPIDIAANLANLLRVMHTGTASTSFKDAAGGEAGWNGSSLVNSYDGALPFVQPGALPGVPNRFDTTMFFLPATNPPTSSDFVSDGGNVVLHYAMGEGDFAVGFNAAGGSGGSVYGILIGLNQALQGMGVRSAAAVQGFSASVGSRDASRRSLVWQLDAGAGAMTPDVHLERDGFNALKIRNNSPQPFSYRLNLAGYEVQPGAGLVEFASDLIDHPGNATVTLKPVFGPERGFLRELDSNNDGVPEVVETLPARGALRAKQQDAGVLALRWRPLSANDTLESTKDLNEPKWSPVNTDINTEGSERTAKVSMSEKHEFFRVVPGSEDCFTLSSQPPGTKPNPWEIGGFKFEAFNAAGAMQPQNSIVTRSGSTGLDVLHTVRIYPASDCDTIHIDVRQTSGLVVFEAVGPLGTVIARRELVGAGTAVQTVTLRGVAARISYVRVISPNALCVIVKVCGERTQVPSLPPPTSSCQSVSNATSGTFDSPLTGRGPFILSSPGGTLSFGSTAGLSGNWLNLFGETQIDLLPPIEGCERVRLSVLDLEGVITAKAFNAAGVEVANAGPLAGSPSPQSLTLEGPGISRVVLFSSSSKALLLNFCCDRFLAP